MKLQTKAVILFNVFIIAVCVIVGFIGYRNSAEDWKLL